MKKKVIYELDIEELIQLYSQRAWKEYYELWLKMYSKYGELK